MLPSISCTKSALRYLYSKKAFKICFYTTRIDFCGFIFDLRYDIDRDGYVIQEDVRLILSHVPIENSINGHVAREGAFTQMGGGR